MSLPATATKVSELLSTEITIQKMWRRLRRLLVKKLLELTAKMEL